MDRNLHTISSKGEREIMHSIVGRRSICRLDTGLVWTRIGIRVYQKNSRGAHVDNVWYMTKILTLWCSRIGICSHSIHDGRVEIFTGVYICIVGYTP